jgi:hypothetical protein
MTSADLDGEPDDVLQDHLGSLPIFSGRLKRAVETSGVTDIQFLPVSIKRFSSAVLHDFYIANILSLVSAVDWSESVYTNYPDDYFIESRRGQVRDLKSPVLVRDALVDHDMLRLAEFPLYICVSERFRGVFESLKCTGYSFRELRVK